MVFAGRGFMDLSGNFAWTAPGPEPEKSRAYRFEGTFEVAAWNIPLSGNLGDLGGIVVIRGFRFTAGKAIPYPRIAETTAGMLNAIGFC